MDTGRPVRSHPHYEGKRGWWWRILVVKNQVKMDLKYILEVEVGGVN